MEKEKEKEDSMANQLTGMQRASKLFIKVDKDGFLLDSVAVSDVVNFDCYESIVTSAKRIVAMFSDLKPDDVHVDLVFYYKRRSRATRMNPQPLLTTTDGFRAVAEHPSGEVPLGIFWTRSSDSVLSGLLKQHLGEKRERSDSPVSVDSHGPPEKKPKADDTPSYKTYMPVNTPAVISTQNKAASIVTDVKKAAKNVTSGGEQESSRPRSIVQSLLKAKVKTLSDKDKADDLKKASRPAGMSNQYQWQDGVSVEVLLNFDGITERRKVKPKIASVIERLMRDNFTDLRADLASELRQEELFKSAQDTINALNFSTLGKGQPIKHIDEAKLEIIKVLSLVKMTKARFKDLLEWMKTLKLEEGLHGKFFLSERSLIGGGLRVIYDTDEQAATALNNLNKARAKTRSTQTLYPVTPLQPSVSILPSGQQHMFVVPNSAGAVSGPTFVTQLSTPMQSDSHLRQALTPVTLSSKQGQGQKENAKTASRLLAGALSSTQVTESGDFHKVNKIPNILRNKAATHKMVASTTNPVPMKLFKSLKEKTSESFEAENTESDSSQSEQPLVIIKQEPIDTYECSLDTDQRDSYKGVLKSDPSLSQEEDQNIDVVIKTERVDDYEA